MRLLGIDLAAQPQKTGVVALEQLATDRWEAVVPEGPADDGRLIELGASSELIGVDAPLGWPSAFVAAVSAHELHQPWPGDDNRRPLTHRRTDDVVRDEGRGQPMSVSADRLGSVAMRCAVLQREWGSRWGIAAPRDGSGRLVEVYPAAAAKAWKVDQRGYRGPTASAVEARESILGNIATATDSWLDITAIEARCHSSDHVLDALLAVLSAVATRIGATRRPAPGDEACLARAEGWIHVPTGPLGEVRPAWPSSDPGGRNR